MMFLYIYDSDAGKIACTDYIYQQIQNCFHMLYKKEIYKKSWEEFRTH